MNCEKSYKTKANQRNNEYNKMLKTNYINYSYNTDNICIHDNLNYANLKK